MLSYSLVLCRENIQVAPSGSELSATAADVSTFCPHPEQNFAPSSNVSPHSMQNFEDIFKLRSCSVWQ
jgi:hypothetical protein